MGHYVVVIRVTCLFLQLFSSAGYNVVLFDTAASQLTGAISSIDSLLRDMESKGLLRSQDMTAQNALELIQTCDDIGKALKGAFYVQV